MSRKVIASKNLPLRMLPLREASIGWLLLDRFGAPQWAHAVFWTLLALLTVATVCDFFTREDVDVLR